jgi:hypothetical protein
MDAITADSMWAWLNPSYPPYLPSLPTLPTFPTYLTYLIYLTYLPNLFKTPSTGNKGRGRAWCAARPSCTPWPATWPPRSAKSTVCLKSEQYCSSYTTHCRGIACWSSCTSMCNVILGLMNPDGELLPRLHGLLRRAISQTGTECLHNSLAIFFLFS